MNPMLQSNALYSIDAMEFCISEEENFIVIAGSALQEAPWNGNVSLIDLDGGDVLASCDVDAGVSDITWCGDQNQWLACAMDNGKVHLVELCMEIDFKLNVHSEFGIHDDIVHALSTNARDRTQIVSASSDGSLKLWDVHNMNTCVGTLLGHGGAVLDVAWNAVDGNTLISGSHDYQIGIWDVRESKAKMGISVSSKVYSVDWKTASTTNFTAGCENGDVHTYDMRSPQKPMSTWKCDGSVLRVLYHPKDDARWMTADSTGKVQMYKEDKAEQIVTTFDEPCRSLAWSTTHIATGSWNKSYKIFEY